MWELDHKEGWVPRIDAFKLWCRRRLLRVPCTARRSNQSILTEIRPGCSLEGLMLKLKLQYFGHLVGGISDFLEEIPSLSHYVVFLYFFALITDEGFLISPCYSLELCIQMGIPFLFSFAYCFSFFTAICKASSDSHFAFLHFCFLGVVLIPVCYTVSQTSIHSSSGILSDLSIW